MLYFKIYNIVSSMLTMHNITSETNYENHKKRRKM